MSTPEKNKGGRPRRISLTEIDRQVFEQIAREGFQTFSELRKGPLRSRQREHSWRIMRRLSNEGLLNASIGDQGRVLGWVITEKGRAEINASDAEDLYLTKVPTYRTSFDHDNALREVKSILCVSNAIEKWVPEAALKAQLSARLQYYNARERDKILRGIPDAVFYLRTGDEQSKAALELELTRKSKMRLFQKLESYITSRDIDFAFYVVKGRDLYDLLWKIYEEILEKSTKVKVSQEKNGIYFTELSVLQKQGLKAKFRSINDELCFAEL